jgi:importin-5
MCLQALDDQAERAKFQVFISPMLNVLATTLNRGEESAAQEFLEMFIEIAEGQPRFLRRNLQEISDAMLQV